MCIPLNQYKLTPVQFCFANIIPENIVSRIHLPVYVIPLAFQNFVAHLINAVIMSLLNMHNVKWCDSIKKREINLLFVICWDKSVSSMTAIQGPEPGLSYFLPLARHDTMS